jgi:hypothetical protein
MTTQTPRPLAVIRSGPIAGVVVATLVLGLTGCAPATQTSAPAATTVATSPTVVPTASPATGGSVSPASPPPPAATAARNPAAMDAAVPYQPAIDPVDFVDVIDNPYWPLTPGTSYEFKGGGEQIKVVVTSERRTVMGVSTIVVSDKVFADGKLAEDTSDWYAQDRAGNVWYFGEATLSFEDDPAGDPAGSWEAGVDGAQPGVVMLADPLGGDVYRQEFYAGEAEDLALVRQANGSITVPAGSYENVLVTEEWTPLEPNVIELKYYAKGIGVVAERQIFGGKDLVELVKVTPAP